VTFFRLLISKRTNYMFACLMLTRLSTMRLEAVEKLIFAYRKHPDLNLLQSRLLLNTPADAVALVRACGYNLDFEAPVGSNKQRA